MVTDNAASENSFTENALAQVVTVPDHAAGKQLHCNIKDPVILEITSIT